MVPTTDMTDLIDGFQPAIDLRERATDDENFWLVPLGWIWAVFSVAVYICKYRLHGTVGFGFPTGWYCKYGY